SCIASSDRRDALVTPFFEIESAYSFSLPRALGGPRLGDLDPVTAVLLGAVQGVVGLLDQVVLIRMAAMFGGADGHGDVEGRQARRRDGLGRQGLTHPFGDDRGLTPVSTRTIRNSSPP